MELRERGVYRLGKAELIAYPAGDGAYALFYPREWRATAAALIQGDVVLWPDGVITVMGDPIKETGADLVDTGKTADEP